MILPLIVLAQGSSNLLNGMVTPPIPVAGRIAMTVIQSPLLKSDNAIARVGYSIYIFRISGTNAPRPGLALKVRDLRSCLRESTQDDFVNAP
jgi:hypothetical protein